ncbi:uncharacterized protein [Oscarella lobularis]|uniref:uncharacterized protein n=1 Tax=Oscarella lobularis TaxID=121494 RepID=UPI003313EB24
MQRDYEDTRIHIGARFDDTDLVRRGIASGIDVNAIGLYEWTALHEAVATNAIEIVRLLLRHGANPNIPDLVSGTTPLHLSAKQGNKEILKSLLECETIDVSQRDDDGNSAADVAADPWCKHMIENETKKRGPQSQKLTMTSRATSRLDVVSSTSDVRETEVPEVCLSFEYNRKTCGLKVRVRKVRKIPKPEGDLASAFGVYVKSYLFAPNQPNTTNQIKSKTEDFLLTDSHLTTDNYLPEIDFSTPLTYTDIRDVTSSYKSLVLGIYFHIGWPLSASVGIASMSLPLKDAVKIVMPTWFGLQPNGVATITKKAWSSPSKVAPPQRNSTISGSSFWNVAALKDFLWSSDEKTEKKPLPTSVIVVEPKKKVSLMSQESVVDPFREALERKKNVIKSRQSAEMIEMEMGKVDIPRRKIKTKRSAEVIDIGVGLPGEKSPPQIRKKSSATIIDMEEEKATIPGLVETPSDKPVRVINAWT